MNMKETAIKADHWNILLFVKTAFLNGMGTALLVSSNILFSSNVQIILIFT